MKLLVLPEDGMTAVVNAIKKAKKSIDITVFRLDRAEIEKALEAAVGRGVRVRTLIAHTNRGGDKLLRKLELRLLGAGVTVARSGDDLARYHAKFMVIDDRTLFVMLFNCTALDAKSRSFGVITTQRAQVLEACRLFEADVTRQVCDPPPKVLVVSPDNARNKLAEFLKGAKKSLWIYDPKINDSGMVRILEERVQKGVDVRVLGTVGKRARQFQADRMKSSAAARAGHHPRRPRCLLRQPEPADGRARRPARGRADRQGREARQGRHRDLREGLGRNQGRQSGGEGRSRSRRRANRRRPRPSALPPLAGTLRARYRRRRPPSPGEPAPPPTG